MPCGLGRLDGSRHGLRRRQGHQRVAVGIESANLSDVTAPLCPPSVCSSAQSWTRQIHIDLSSLPVRR